MADTILVIEDKDSMLDMLKQTLEGAGYQVIPARDGAEGIKKLSDERIGLVLTDLKLPKKDGFEVLKVVKQHGPFLPVIVMTAFGTIEIAVKAVKDGAYDFLTKPFDPFRAVFGRDDVIARAFESLFEHVEHAVLVFNNENRVGHEVFTSLGGRR